jgi:flagellar basal-body rod modification protein FlgD
MSVANLVGKQVTFKADHLALTKGSPTSFDISLDAASDATVINITDATGRVVRTLDVGARPTGSSSVTWDGLDGNGQGLPTGDYYLSVTAKKLDGTAVNAASAVRGVVASVDFDGQVPQLVVAGQRVKLGDVTGIGVPPPGA